MNGGAQSDLCVVRRWEAEDAAYVGSYCSEGATAPAASVVNLADCRIRDGTLSTLDVVL